MAGLPRSIIKKYGVTKKAWSIFRSGRSPRSSRSVKSTRRTSNMARRRGFKAKARSYARAGGNKLMNGFYKPSGILGNVVMGVGAASLATQIPVSVPYKEEIAAGIVGGLPGAAAVWFLKNRNGMGSGSTGSIEYH